MRIELRGVRKQFGKVIALRGLDLDIPSGRRVALVGPNASGKSTATRVIMGLMGCEGTVRVGGFEPRLQRTELAREMAYVPQVAPQLRAPVGEVVRAVAAVRDIERSRIEETCARLGVDLAAVERQPFRNLSGGMKQKILIVLALSTGAKLLILDEPTASLDTRTRDRFFQLFDDVARDATVVLCSHRLDEVRRLVTHVVALEEGRLAYEGTVDDFLATGSRDAPSEPGGLPEASSDERRGDLRALLVPSQTIAAEGDGR